ncbi:MarR family winged helix-turn-helix transcriptional regulator [Gilvimarinus sp. F26214L]|uniref:MarR family winged helix-turn-helix transcriptional regulator n=1 Tax=Gilvimarinus sp. DZF01 TaxID=3461371 RepID=UPI0040463764
MKPKKTTGTSTPEMPELSQMLGHHLRRAHLSLWRRFNQKVGDGGLRPGQVGMLSAIDNNPGISQTDISRLLDLDKASVVSLMYRLEKEGLATRKQAKEDRRRHELFLTAKGKRKVKTLRRNLQTHEQRFRRRFSASEYAQFIEFLQRVYQDEKTQD